MTSYSSTGRGSEPLFVWCRGAAAIRSPWIVLLMPWLQGLLEAITTVPQQASSPSLVLRLRQGTQSIDHVLSGTGYVSYPSLHYRKYPGMTLGDRVELIEHQIDRRPVTRMIWAAASGSSRGLEAPAKHAAAFFIRRPGRGGLLRKPAGARALSPVVN